MKKNLICIVCPRGCSLAAEVTRESVTVTGHSCPRGEAYAVSECLHPVRTVTATVRVANRENTMVSVKTDSAIPKDNMMEIMTLLRKTKVLAPLEVGEIVLKNVFGTNIVITKAIQ